MKDNKTDKQKTIFVSLNKKLFALILLCLTAFFFIQIYITSLVGTKSAEVEAVRIEKDQIRLENEILKSRIDENKSIAKLEEFIKVSELKSKAVNEIELNDNNVAMN